MLYGIIVFVKIKGLKFLYQLNLDMIKQICVIRVIRVISGRIKYLPNLRGNKNQFNQ